MPVAPVSLPAPKPTPVLAQDEVSAYEEHTIVDGDVSLYEEVTLLSDDDYDEDTVLDDGLHRGPPYGTPQLPGPQKTREVSLEGMELLDASIRCRVPISQ